MPTPRGSSATFCPSSHTDPDPPSASDIEGAEGNSNGLGLEFYVETPAEELGAEVGQMAGSWQFQLLYQISQLAASAAASAQSHCCYIEQVTLQSLSVMTQPDPFADM